jgi:hypothetical protein
VADHLRPEGERILYEAALHRSVGKDLFLTVLKQIGGRVFVERRFWRGLVDHGWSLAWPWSQRAKVTFVPGRTLLRPCAVLYRKFHPTV